MSFFELFLKVILVLVCFIGFVVAVFLAAVLLPVKTKLKVKGENRSTDVLFHATWLFGLVSFKIQYLENRILYHGRILIFRFLDGEVGPDEFNRIQEVFKAEDIFNEAKADESDNAAKTKTGNNKENPETVNHNPETGKKEEGSKTENNDIDPEKEKREKQEQVFEQHLGDIPMPQANPMSTTRGKIGYYRRKWRERRKAVSLRRVEFLGKTLLQKYRAYRTKRKEIKEILSTESGRRAKKVLKVQCLKFVNHVKPRNSKGNLTFGFDQPDLTAIAYGFGAAFKANAGNGKMIVIPDFYYKGIKSDFVVTGRLIVAYIVYCGLKLILNRDVDRVQKAIRRVF